MPKTEPSPFATMDRVLSDVQQRAQDRSLLAFAKQHGLHITAGFDPSGGGHNTGSKHYQGDAQHPGAIDVDNKGVNLANLRELAAQNGYTVRDERSHPQGQAKWTGPHYHIELGSQAQPQRQQAAPVQAPAQPLQLPTIPSGAAVVPLGNLNLPNPQQAKTLNSTRTQEITPAPVAVSSPKPKSEPDNAFSAMDRVLADVQKRASAPAPAQPKPETPDLIHGVGNLVNAGVNYVKGVAQQVGQIPQAVGQEAQQFTQDPNAGLKAYAATGTGLAQGVRDLAQFPLSLLSNLQNAYMGRQVSQPLVELPNVRDIPLVGQALDQNMQNHPVFSTTGNLVGQSLPALELGGMALKGLKGEPPVVKELSTPEPQYRTQADIIRNLQGLDNAEKIRQIGQDVQAGINPVPNPEPVNTKELTQAFRERGGEVPNTPPKGNLDAQVLGPGGQPISQQVDKLKTPYEVALERSREPQKADSSPYLDISKAPVGRTAPFSIKDGFMTGSDGSTVLGRVKMADGQVVNNPIHGEFRNDLPIMMEEGKHNLYDGEGQLIEKGFGARHQGEGETPKLAANKKRRLEEAGFSNEMELVDHVSKNYSQVYEQLPKNPGDEPRYLLVDPDRNVALEVVEFRRGNGQDYYGVTTSFAAGDLKYPNKRGLLIWEKDPTLARSADSLIPPDSTARLGSDNAASPGSGGQTKDLSSSIAPLKSDLNPPAILNEFGRPMREIGAPEKTGNFRELEIPGRPKPSNQPLELPRRASKTQELPSNGVDMVPGTSKMKELVQDNQSPVPKAGEAAQIANNLPATDQPINPAKPRTLESVQAAQSKGVELMNVADAENFIKKYQPSQLSHFQNVLEAAKNNQTVLVDHKPLEGGGRVENSREIHPVDFGKKTIKGSTEVSNLIKEFSPDETKNYEAVRDNLVQRLAANKVQVSAKEQNITGKTPLATRRILNKLANRLPEQERTHVYIMDHNLDTTERGQSFGFRRMDRITNSSLTGKQQAVPVTSLFQNKIKPAFDGMRELANMPETPPQVSKFIKDLTEKGVANRKSTGEFKTWLRDNYAQFCKTLGLE